MYDDGDEPGGEGWDDGWEFDLSAWDWLPPAEAVNDPAVAPSEPDWLGHPDYADLVPAGDRLVRWLGMHPSLRPTGAIAALDPALLSAGQRVDHLVLVEQQGRWLEATKVGTLAVIDRADETDLRLSAEVVAIALRTANNTAQLKLKTASTLTESLPKTLGLLCAGKVSLRHAEAVAEVSWRLRPDLADALEQSVAGRAPEQNPGQFRRSLRRAELRLGPDGAEQRHKTAYAERKVGYQDLDDGMASLPVYLDAADAQAVFTRLTAAATLLPATDKRSMDQRRADLLVHAVLAGIPDGRPPKLQGRKPSIQVVVSADTLLDLDDEPGHLDGHGPITAHHARRLAADQSATWRRLLTDPDTGAGALLDINPHTHRPSQRLRDYVAARDGCCAHPGCSQPAYRCEYEHIIGRAQGGTTCRCNGALACRRHNQRKYQTGHHYTLNPDGTFTWTDDTGHPYTSHPEERWTPPPSRIQPPPKPQPTTEQIHQLEDTKYDELNQKLHHELDRARKANDQDRITQTEGAISSAQSQRERQLRHRQNPNHPPF